MLTLVCISGCVREKTTAPPVAIATIENLGGRIEPERPSAGHPVFRVSLSNTAISDAQLQYLDAFPGLRLLALNNTEITDAGVQHLKKLRNLKRISVVNTQISMSGLRELRNAIPALHIQR
jgi:hypothetical protein